MTKTQCDNNLIIYINGKLSKCINPNPSMTLLSYLRDVVGIKGTKLGCGEGGCGACTVMVSFYNFENSKIEHINVNACLTPVCSLDNCAITTVEGIGGLKSGLHPVQQRMASFHGSQCGYCTPGIVMSIYTLFRRNPNATPHEIEENLDGNLCRCTGYRPILDAAKSLCCKQRDVSSGNSSCACKVGNTSSVDENESSNESTVHIKTEIAICSEKSYVEEILENGLTEPIFPSGLVDSRPRSLRFNSNDVTWHQPIDLVSLLELKKQHHSNAKLVVGNTEIGIETRFKAMNYSILINVRHINELQTLKTTEYNGVKGIIVGGSVTLNRLREFIDNLVTLNTGNESFLYRGFVAINFMLKWFASNQIRNVACIAGNIITASPISDLNPMLISNNAIIKLSSLDKGARYLPIENFFVSYRKVDIFPDEILESVFIPFTSEFEFVIPFKQARRREDDISIVTAGVNIKLFPSVSNNDSSNFQISSMLLSYGGMAPTTIIARKTGDHMINKVWDLNVIEIGCKLLSEELILPSNVPGGQAEYRTSLAVSFLFKTYFIVTQQLQSFLNSSHGLHIYNKLLFDIDVQNVQPKLPVISDRDKSGSNNFITSEKDSSRGEQLFTRSRGGLTYSNKSNFKVETLILGPNNENRSPVGDSLQHKSANIQVTGEAQYVDDIPLPNNALHAALVTSTKAHAKIVNIDLEQAIECDGYIAFYSAKDITGSNHIGPVIKDEEVFASDVVKHYGAVIGVVIATTHEKAVKISQKVVITYEELPSIITIQEAIQSNSYFNDNHSIVTGNLEKQVKASDLIVEGEFYTGGQEHFYLETNCSVVTPSDGGRQLEIISSTQNLSKTQHFVAAVVGIPANQVVAKCKRLGGGFGGKETRSVFIACAAAIAAHHLNQPISINIERDVDMSITGQRHAFYFKYRAGVNSVGSLTFFDAKIYSNGGYSLDLSQAVADRALFHSDNCYNWPAFQVSAKVCKTNQPSHTAFRGFGGPQGMMLTEVVMMHLHHELALKGFSLPMHDFKALNFYKNGINFTHFGQRIEHFYIPALWEQALTKSDYVHRLDYINSKFNPQNRWKKRGIAITPTKFGINFTAKFMNCGSALVHIYQDGTVLVSHGGTEMGQGLHTKIIQIVSQKFGIPDDFVYIAETSTNTVANASPTAASMSTDLYGMAVLNACDQLLERLSTLQQEVINESGKGKEPDAISNWKLLIVKAFFNRVNLSSYGYFEMDSNRCGYDWDQVIPIEKFDEFEASRETNQVKTLNHPNSLRGNPFNYFTQGVAVSEVEIDCLTGDCKLLRADVFMDLGKSINPSIDIGQIEGAFVQGYGWCTMEELIWGDNDHPWVKRGQLFTRGPGTYKIPSFNDCPIDFRVNLMDTDNRFAVHSSKAVGEPPFFLGACPFFAIRNAVQAARIESGLSEHFLFNLPATSERIRMACIDQISTLTTKSDKSFQPKGSW